MSDVTQSQLNAVRDSLYLAISQEQDAREADIEALRQEIAIVRRAAYVSGGVTVEHETRARAELAREGMGDFAAGLYDHEDEAYNFPLGQQAYLRGTIRQVMEAFFSYGLRYGSTADIDAATDEVYYGMRQIAIADFEIDSY